MQGDVTEIPELVLKNKLKHFIAALCCTAAFSGCILADLGAHYITRHSKDVSDDPEYWGGYEPGALDRLEREVTLQESVAVYRKKVLVPIRDEENKHLGSLLYGSPTPDEYERNPSEWPDMIGFIPAGTPLRVNSIRLEGSSLTDGDMVAVYATVEAGEFQGTRVDISDLSKWVEEDPHNVSPQRPDPKLLTKVEESTAVD